MKSSTDVKSIAHTFTTMRLMGTQQYLTVRRYQMKSTPPPILREKVEAAVKALKIGKSAGVDNIPAELVN